MFKHSISKKAAIMIAAAVIAAAGASVTTEAAMGGGSFVAANGAADSITVNGVTVEALYKARTSGYDSDTTYCCAAFVKRFYSQVYGRNVYNLNSTTSVPMIDSGSFSVTKSPKVGDILRDNQSVHWAIVKEVKGDTVTLIQQNAWNSSYTKAWVGATAELDDSRYTYFTWSGNKGENKTEGMQDTHDFSFNYHSLERYDTNAVIHTKVNNPERLRVQQVGCRIYDENGKVIKEHLEFCVRDESRFNIWYDFNGELGVTLTPGTEYSYQFYVVYNGTMYDGPKETFTTTGTAMKKNDGIISDEIKKEMLDKKCGKAPSLKYASDGWMTFKSMIGESEKIVQEQMDDPEKVKDGVNYYLPERCGAFSAMAPTAFEMKDGKVESITWKYTYDDSSDKARSRKFYKGLAKEGNKVWDEEGTGMCENKNQMCTIWEDKAEIEWEMEDGVPTVTITVISE